MEELFGLARVGELSPASKYMDESTGLVVDVEEDVQRLMFDKVADIKQFIQAQQRSVQFSAIEMGYALLQIEKDKLHRYVRENGGYGYTSFYRFCEDMFGFKDSTVKNMLRVARAFCSADGNLPLEYSMFSFSQLVEMEAIKREYRARIAVDCSVRDIRRLKKFYENYTPRDGTTWKDDLEIIKQAEQEEKDRKLQKKNEIRFYPATNLASFLPTEEEKANSQTSDQSEKAAYERARITEMFLDFPKTCRERIEKKFRESGKDGLESIIKNEYGVKGSYFDGLSIESSPSKGLTFRCERPGHEFTMRYTWVGARNEIIDLIEKGVYVPKESDSQTSDYLEQERPGEYESERCLSTPPSDTGKISYEHISRGLFAQLHLLSENVQGWSTFASRVMSALDRKNPMYLIEYDRLCEKRKENIALSIEVDRLKKSNVVPSSPASGERLDFKSAKDRKEFLENYKKWGVWYDLPDLGKKFYRYDFINGTSIIVEDCKTYYSFSTNKEPGDKQVYSVLDDEHTVFDSNGIGGISKAVEWMTRNRDSI